MLPEVEVVEQRHDVQRADEVVARRRDCVSFRGETQQVSRVALGQEVGWNCTVAVILDDVGNEGDNRDDAGGGASLDGADRQALYEAAEREIVQRLDGMY